MKHLKNKEAKNCEKIKMQGMSEMIIMYGKSEGIQKELEPMVKERIQRVRGK